MKLNNVTFGAKLWIDTTKLDQPRVDALRAALSEATGHPIAYEFALVGDQTTVLNAKSDDVELLRRLGRESKLPYRTDGAKCDNRKGYPAPEGFITVA
jgi:hypothetical protein